MEMRAFIKEKSAHGFTKTNKKIPNEIKDDEVFIKVI